MPTPDDPTDVPIVRFLRHLADDPIAALAGLTGSPPARLLAAVALLAVTVLLARSLFRRHWWRRQSADARLLTIRPPATVDPAGAIVFWRALTGLLAPAWKRWLCGQPPLAVEYRFTIEGARIGLWVPAAVPPGLAEHAITAAWPGAQITTAPDTTPPHAAALGGQLVLLRPEYWPLNTRHDTDPLRPLLEAASELRHGETATAQILTRPATGRRLRPVRAATRGQPPAHSRTVSVTARTIAATVNEIISLFLPGGSPRTGTSHHYRATAGVTDDLRPVREKATQPQWETVIRYAITTTARGAPARQRLRGLTHEIAATFSVHTGHNSLRRRHLSNPVSALTARSMRRGFLLSVPELAALAHLPYDDNTPSVERAGARSTAPLPRIPTAGADVKTLGIADAGPSRPVGIRVADSCHHIHVTGATGSGKSTLLAHLIHADATAGRGLLAIEPRGDLILDILDRLPAHAADRVVLFDPDDPTARPALNVLAGPDPHTVTDNLVGIFRRIYADYWGPRTDDILRAACLTLRANTDTARPATLADIPDLLTNPSRRTELTTGLDDPVLAGFWEWYHALSEPARAHAIAPLMNKLRAFLLRTFVRDTLCARTDSVNLGRLLDADGICLVRVPKGSLGTDTARLFGSLVLAKAWEALTHRARIDAHQRRDCSIYLDEAQNFLTLPHGIDDMLAEARGYRVSLVLAHQDQAQLPPALREAISANARNKIYFAVSPEDATSLHRHVHPQLTPHDLSHLDAFHAAARLIVAGAETPAFTFTTRPLPPPVPGRARHIRAHANYPNPRPITTKQRTTPDARSELTGGVAPRQPRQDS
ncbi:TraM recognition domain-containing protein [Actinokineospora xionganensis]|uniref:TraM recognition domain-containing protein n=1 Tax=Actinokineospora xionganensis TaxID=2684470 RepID=A0ABR7LF44_9PSEU|nr:TraM recognition domain-containing protein [Actinokineospora xionganensis]MBC6451345.1 TraM recognition domain-containing protein [Actinokineospora xionganensis]